MASRALPALDIRPPEQQDPMQAFSRLVQLKGLMNNQAMQQEQLKGEQLRNTLEQMQIDTTKAVNTAYQSALKVDDKGIPTVDQGELTKHLAASDHGAAIPGILENLTKYQKARADRDEAQAKVESAGRDSLGFLGQAIQKANYDPKLADLLITQRLQTPGVPEGEAKQLSDLQAQIKQTPEALKQITDNLVTQSNAPRERAAAETQAEARLLQAKRVPADQQELTDAVTKGYIKSPAEFPAWKAAQEHAAELPYQLKLKEAEVRATQLIQGMTKPAYAIPKDGSAPPTLMSETDALKKGWVVEPVTATRIQADVMLNNRLVDVHQKTREFYDAMKKPITDKERSNIAALLDPNNSQANILFGKFPFGGLGTKVPSERLDKWFQQANLRELGPAARDILVTNLNAREAMAGYNRVLTNSGRPSDKQMELNLQTLADPSISDQDYASRAEGAFFENLKIVGQGLPKIPGVKSADEWEAGYQKKNAPAPEHKTIAPTPFKQGGVPGPGTAQFHYQGKKGEIFSNDGQTWYDAQGKQLGGK